MPLSVRLHVEPKQNDIGRAGVIRKIDRLIPGVAALVDQERVARQPRPVLRSDPLEAVAVGGRAVARNQGRTLGGRPRFFGMVVPPLSVTGVEGVDGPESVGVINSEDSESRAPASFDVVGADAWAAGDDGNATPFPGSDD